MTGAKYFSDQLSSNGGNVLKTFGGYNGWVEGMTVVSSFSRNRRVSRGAEGIFSRLPLPICVILPATRRTTLTSRCSVLTNKT